MVRVCDYCLKNEHCIVMSHRLRNLKLKYKISKTKLITTTGCIH